DFHRVGMEHLDGLPHVGQRRRPSARVVHLSPEHEEWLAIDQKLPAMSGLLKLRHVRRGQNRACDEDKSEKEPASITPHADYRLGLLAAHNCTPRRRQADLFISLI